MNIAENHVVGVQYILHSIEENGEKTFIEQTNLEQPLTFLYGVGMMLPKFEEELAGLSEGDKKSFTLAPQDAYGERFENATTQLPAEMFQQMGMPPVGAVLPLQDQNGNAVNATVLEVSPEMVTVDLNHPMAGKTLEFEVEVVLSRPATEEELAHGHAHGADGHSGH
ncbi:peptidylprolyl isomerase [Elizabethkingia sp. JS20170427COW]|uniref:FKBP-type peptidyl-prolyl cis-trans isomerase n=1 Tax=Elizabethkingia sp. JS20170427COW TaxID=2583851 RepID=UPI001110E3D0|nr:peptidylprolyl isomerase [Elizabethkingia sp. JS20170427COW]QCX53590.1 peptidylprolyl isomerase [Elizabethkingia sp. JS20170427COW]